MRKFLFVVMRQQNRETSSDSPQHVFIRSNKPTRKLDSDVFMLVSDFRFYL
jgi:hypothetical protein